MSVTDPAHDPRLFTLRRRHPASVQAPIGERLADRIATIIGSWTFILIQSGILLAWIALNLVAWTQHWDPYPFILLNLALSFQAAFTAPILLMSQNRQAAIDRRRAQLDYDVNLKAELDIEALHQKLDLLREQDIGKLVTLVETLTRERMDRSSRTTPDPR